MNSPDRNELIFTDSSQPASFTHQELRAVLDSAGFQVLAEATQRIRENSPHRALTCVVLVVWSPFLAYESQLLDPQAGMLLPFCIILIDDGRAASKVVCPNYQQIVAGNPSLATGILGRVLDSQIAPLLHRVSETPRYRDIVQCGGGEYRGIQPGVWRHSLPDLILFDDPETHTTLAVPAAGAPITAATIRRKIASSRSRFNRGTTTTISRPLGKEKIL